MIRFVSNVLRIASHVIPQILVLIVCNHSYLKADSVLTNAQQGSTRSSRVTNRFHIVLLVILLVVNVMSLQPPVQHVRMVNC